MQVLTSLEVLDMHSNLLESLDGLSALTNLRRLNLAGNRISQLCPLSMLSCLEDLNLSRNFLTHLKVQEASSCQEGEDAQAASLPNSLRKLNLAANRCAMGCSSWECLNCMRLAVYGLITCTITKQTHMEPSESSRERSGTWQGGGVRWQGPHAQTQPHACCA